MIWLLILAHVITIPAALYVGVLAARRGEIERLALALDLYDEGQAADPIEGLMDSVREVQQK